MMVDCSTSEDLGGMPSNAMLTAFCAIRSALQSAWLFYVDLPLAVISDVLHTRKKHSGLASLQTAVGLQRAVSELVQLLLALYLQVLRWVPVFGGLLSTCTAILLGPLAPGVRQRHLRRQRHRSPMANSVGLTGPTRVAFVLNELSCSQAEMQALGRLIVWCLQEGAHEITVFDPQGMMKAHSGWLIQEIAINSHGIYAARPVKRDTAVLPQYRRPPMTLKVRPTTSHAAEGRRGFSVQLLSLKDTFASVGRLADQSNRPSSSSSELRFHIDWVSTLTKRPDPHKAAARPGSLDEASSASSGAETFSSSSDPQAVLVFGSCFTIGGFPPWMLQYAEMYHMGQLQGINRLQVRAQFAKYAGTTQRNGT